VRLANIFQIEREHAERVASTSQHLLKQLLPYLPLKECDPARLLKKLNWAAQLHEIGCLISHESHHKHGAYILDHVDVAGFSLHELHRLSLLVLGQRGKLKKLGDSLDDSLFAAQLLCLRLAVIICHARGEVTLKGVDISVTGKSKNQFFLSLPRHWSFELPQTVYLLHEELVAWSKFDASFNFSTDN
jgi:exopolyphosphatase / guanosine-5'-triphosphate,3'-diphosphate pyrophosphatase